MLNIIYTYTHIHNKKASRKIFLGTLFFNTVYVYQKRSFIIELMLKLVYEKQITTNIDMV